MTRLLAFLRHPYTWCAAGIVLAASGAAFLTYKEGPSSVIRLQPLASSEASAPSGPEPALDDIVRFGDLECGRLSWSSEDSHPGRVAQLERAGFRVDAAAEAEYVPAMTCKYMVGFPGFHLQLMARREPTASLRREWIVASAKGKQGPWARQAFTSGTVASDGLECEIVGARLGLGPSEDLPVSGTVDVRCEASLGGATLSASREEFYVIDLMKRSITRLYACEGSGRVVEWPGGDGSTILLPEMSCASDFVIAY